MTVRVQTSLHERLRNGTVAVRDESTFKQPLKITLCRGSKPRGFPRLRTGVSLDKCIERDGRASLVFLNER
jgi:hypothetical protein